MNRLVLCFLTIAAGISPLSSAGVAQQQQVWDYEAPADRSYLTASFRCWIPEGLKSPRAVLVLVPGQNVDGRKDVQDVQWQELARRERLALVGVFFKGDAVHDYSQAERGSGLALVRALDEFSRKPGAHDLSLAKLFLRGVSTGGQFAFSFAQYQPQRVAGFASLDGVYFISFPTGGGQRVPGLYAVRGAEADVRVQKNLLQFSKNRERGALWAFVRYPGDAEEPAMNDFFATFLGEVLKARLNPLSPLSGLENLTEIRGWGGQLQSRQIVPGGKIRRGAEPVYAWLVSEALAQAWVGSGVPTQVKEPPPPASREYQ